MDNGLGVEAFPVMRNTQTLNVFFNLRLPSSMQYLFVLQEVLQSMHCSHYSCVLQRLTAVLQCRVTVQLCAVLHRIVVIHQKPMHGVIMANPITV